MIKRKPLPVRWAAVPLLAAGLLASGVATANAAATPDGQIIRQYSPGTNSNAIDSYLENNDSTTHMADLTITWQAPPNSTFSNNTVAYELVNSDGTSTLNKFLPGCVLSNGNASLTCPAASIMVPGNSLGRFVASIDIAATAPYNSTFQSQMGWTSSDEMEIGSGANLPGYRTPREAPTPIIDPLVALSTAGVLAVGATGALAVSRRRRSEVSSA